MYYDSDIPLFLWILVGWFIGTFLGHASLLVLGVCVIVSVFLEPYLIKRKRKKIKTDDAS